jgi:hypothetical protein
MPGHDVQTLEAQLRNIQDVASEMLNIVNEPTRRANDGDSLEDRA